MKKFAIWLIIIPVILSCMLEKNMPLGETNFPLAKARAIAIETKIEEIALGNTWIAVQTENSIIALDINTFETLWTIDMQVNVFGEGFQIVDDMLVTISEDQLIIVDRQGNKKVRDLNADVKQVVEILGAYPNYVYIVGGSYWSLEAYDLSEDRMLWKSRVGRTVGDVFYDPSNNIAYLTRSTSVRAYDNSSGQVLWERDNVYGQGSLYSSGILYVSVPNNSESRFRLIAINGVSQEILWEKDIPHPADIKATSSTVIDNLLIYRGSGMIAVDRINGNVVWTTPDVGEEFYGIPVEFDGVIYAKGEATGTVYAISFDDGTVLGHTRVDDSGYAEVSGRIFALKDGIMFSTRNEIIVYKRE